MLSCFFQAEDGIRDIGVTGVQTCALPIFQRHRMLTIQWQPLSPAHGYVLPADVVSAGLGSRFEAAMERSAALLDALAARFRSEERRVGKEGRSRWSP